MTEFELHSLISQLYDNAHYMVEFWLSATFAVIVARFIASEYLTSGVLRLMAVLYLAATVLAILRYSLLLARATEYRNELSLAGLEPFYQPPISFAVLGVVTGLYILGAWGTLRFLVGAWAPEARLP